MSELSPAAQAVWDAAWANTPVQCGDIEGTRRAQIAAALRAAADGWRIEVGGITQTDFIRGVLRGAEALEEIADELEAQ